MNSVYILNQNFSIEAIIDNYVSCIWRASYFEVGDFELYLGATRELINLLQINKYLVRSCDATVDESGKVTFKKVMIIKNVEIVTNVESGDFLTVTGRELKYVLNQRIVWSQTNLRGTAEAGIRQLVTENAISPTDNKRVIPNLQLGAVTGLTDTISKQLTGTYLDVAITNICEAYGYGWDVYLYDGKMRFIVYAGLNRSYEQTDRPYVIFSNDFENLYNTDYQLKTEGYANTALIGGEGEGVERTYTTLNNTTTGLNRYEIFVDAKDISSNKDSEDEIPQDQYVKLLQERGREHLASLSYTEGFSGEVISDLGFKYGQDFGLGDIVTVINEYGISKNVRVLSAIESEDETGVKLVPQFNF